MNWMAIALIIVLGCVVAILAYVLLAGHRKQSQKVHTTQPLPVANGSASEDNARQHGATPHQTEVAKNLSSEPSIPEDLSTHEEQIGFPEKKLGAQETESEAILPPDEGRQEPEGEGEILAEQTIDGELKTDVIEPIPPTEEVKPLTKEQEPSGDRIKEDDPPEARETRGLPVEDADVSTSKADDAEIKNPDVEETVHGTAEEDIQKQPSETHMKNVDGFESKAVNLQADETVHEAELQELERTRRAKKKEGQREPIRAAISSGMPGDHDRLTVDGKVMRDGTEVRQPKKRKAKTKRKNILQQLPGKSCAQLESEEEKRLLAEVVEILEGRKLPEDRSRQRRPSRYRPPSQEPLVAPQLSAKRRSADRSAREHSL